MHILAPHLVLKYCHRNLETSILLSILWMLEDLKRSEEHLLNVPSYGKLLREPILYCTRKLQSKKHHFFPSKTSTAMYLLYHCRQPWSTNGIFLPSNCSKNDSPNWKYVVWRQTLDSRSLMVAGHHPSSPLVSWSSPSSENCVPTWRSPWHLGESICTQQ